MQTDRVYSHKDAVLEAYKREVVAPSYQGQVDLIDTLVAWLESPHEHPIEDVK